MSEVTTVPFSFGPRFEKGICKVCGKPAYKGSSTVCEDHRTGGKPKKDAQTTVRPNADYEPIRVAQPGAPAAVKPPQPVKTDSKAERAAVLAQSIKTDLNPVLLQGYAMLCQPIPTENFYTTQNGRMVPTPLGETVMIGGMKADLLAKGLAELEKSPVSMAAEAYIKPFLPVVYGVLALGVVGFHGYQLVTVREQLMRQYQGQLAAEQNTTPPAEQAAQAQAAEAYAPPEGVPHLVPDFVAGSNPTDVDIQVDLAPPPDTEVNPADLPDVGATVGNSAA